VFSRPRAIRDILSAWFLIQSPGKNCEHIRSRLDIHLAKMRKNMANMTDEKFETVKSAVNTTISEKDKNIQEDFNRMWSEFSTHAYIFDRQQKDIEMLASITKAELQAYFEQLFFQPNRANRLDMHWNSQVIKEAAPEEEKKEAATEEAKKPEEAVAAAEGEERRS